jgi:hypothetical protein
MRPWHCRRSTAGRLAGVAAATLALLSMADQSMSQSYSFSVPEATVTVEIMKDGSARITYDLLFENEGSDIDVVDIGMPTEEYRLESCMASLDGEPQTDIRRSEYVDIGIEVHLNPPIGSGYDLGDLGMETLLPQKGGEPEGRLVVSCVNPDMVYEDTTDKAYASFRFTPTWFEPSFIHGTTRLQLRTIIPGLPGKDEIKWHDEAFDMVGEYEDTGRAMVVWNRPDYSLTGPHLFGVSFPRRFVDNVIEMTLWRLFWTWFKGSTNARMTMGTVILGLLTLGFFLTTRNTGCALWLVLAGVSGFLLYAYPASNFILLPPAVALLAYGVRVRTKKRGWDYIRAVATVPGGGIRRGLTAVESAVLLQLEEAKILTIMTFGMVKKGILKVTSESPFTVALAGGTLEATIEAMKKSHVPVRGYERDALKAIDAASGGLGDTDLSSVNFTKTLEDLIRHVTDKIRGFDVAETTSYYNKIVARAWKEAERGAASLRPEIFEASMDWMLLDKGFGDKVKKMDLGPSYRPVWIPRPAAAAAGGGGGLLSGGGGPGPGPGLGDVAKSIAGRFENMGKSLAGAMDLGGTAGGGIDLSGLDKLTSDVLKSAAKGAGSGGGGGGCACACAGCACACACAGGGR